MSFFAVTKKDAAEIDEQNGNASGATIRLTVEYRIDPSRSGFIHEGFSMEETVNANLGSQSKQFIERRSARAVTEHDTTKYISSIDRNTNDHLPPKHLPPSRVPESQHARLVPTSNVSSSDDEKVDEVLVRDTIVQHISEDEKSTSSEEVVFEEWSEEFRCRRTDEYDNRTNQLLRTVIDETSERVKSDVIKEEYKEKNERIKGHRSYDIVKEVYRRVPAHLVDPTKTNVIPIERSKSHLYEEITPAPPSVITSKPTPYSSSNVSPTNRYHLERPSRDRHWSSEDIYTTEIVYDPELAREYESLSPVKRSEPIRDSSTPPSFTRNYDRVRPGQYPPIPPSIQTTSSIVPSSNYDRITSIAAPPTQYGERRSIQEQDQIVSEEYTIEVEHVDSSPTSKTGQRNQQQQKYEETSEEDNAYQFSTNANNETNQRSSTVRTSDWRSKYREIYGQSSDEDRFDQFGKKFNGSFTAQLVSIVPSNTQQRFKEVEVKLPVRERVSHDQNPSKSSPAMRHAVKEVLVCVSRGPSPEKQLHQQIYHRISSSDEDEQERRIWLRVDSQRARETTKTSPSITRIDTERPTPPKRSVSSSSIIDERRAQFEQQQHEMRTNLSTDQTDRPSYGRVGELKNAFELSANQNIRDEINKVRTPISTSLTEERRKLFEQQDTSPISRRSTNEYQADERRLSETHTGPSLITDRVTQIESPESKSTSRIQIGDRLGRTGFDQIKSSLDSSMNRTTEPSTIPQASVEITYHSKQVISSVDSDVSGRSPPIHQSTPKSTKKIEEDDAGHESEDELSDPTMSARQHEQQHLHDIRRRTPKARVRDFSQSTPQTAESSNAESRVRSTFNEENMENMLAHVPISKGKALLIELSPRPSHESPITNTMTKSGRDPNKSIIGSDSGIFEYSTATSHHPGISSSSWRNNGSSSIIDDANRTSTIRDSGAYVDSSLATPTASLRYGRRQTSDTDQTTIHGGDDSVSRSTYKYETEIVSNDPNQHPVQPPPRYIRRQITRSPPSEYENIANYHSGLSSERKVPITTQSRSVITKPIIVDEIETIETETRVECQVQRTHEIKESTTKTERAASPNAPRKVVTTTTTTTTTTTRSPENSSDEAARVLTPAKRVLLNERPQYYDSNRSTNVPISIHPPSRDSPQTPTKNIRQGTQTYHESGIHQYRLDSPPSDRVSYTIAPPATMEDELIRIEETRFKPIQRDRSQDSLLQSPVSRSNVRTLSAGPRTMEITSFSPQNQVTFGKYTPNEIIAIVRVPELSNGGGTPVRPSPTPQSFTAASSNSPIRHGISESELNMRARKEDERPKLHYQRVHATSYNPPQTAEMSAARQSRSRAGPYERSGDASTPVNAHTRSSSYHSTLHEQDRQQQRSQGSPTSPTGSNAYRPQVQRRSGSLGNLLGANIEFEIEIEKRPPQQPEQPTSVTMDQASRAIVTTSRDGRVSIQNVAARPGNTVVINSDFHSSDRSLNRSSGYFSSDELRSQGLTANYSSDEQSSGAGIINQNSNLASTPAHARRYRINEQNGTRIPANYRPKPNSYQQLNNDDFEQVNQIVQRYYQESVPNPHVPSQRFNETINQIDALYTNLEIQNNNEFYQDRRVPQQTNENFTTTLNRRRQLSPNSDDYLKRYTSTGFQNVSSQNEQTKNNSTLRHLVSPPTTSASNEKRRTDPIESHRALSDNENVYRLNSSGHPWGSTSLNDLAGSVPVRPSQSLSSSGILADYTTPGSTSPNSGFGSTQNVILQRNRLNDQAQVVQRNRTSVKQMKLKSAAKKKFTSQPGQYSDEEDDNDSVGGHDSPLSDNGQSAGVNSMRHSNYSHRHQ